MKFLAPLLETLLNQAFHSDPHSLQALGQLAGKIIRVDVYGIPSSHSSLYFFPDSQGILVFNQYHGDIDVHLAGPPITLLRLLLEREKTLQETPEVTVHGDVNLAQQGLDIIHHLQIDWENTFAQWLGKDTARQVVNQCRKGQHYSSTHWHTLQHQVIDSLPAKTGHLPTRAQWEGLCQNVNLLQKDLDRLEQRIQRLNQ